MTASASFSGTVVSAADLGTNTVKITHAMMRPDGVLVEIREAAETIRLGKSIEDTGQIAPERIDACLAVLKAEESFGRQFGGSIFIGVATEALRVASNGQDLLGRIASETSWDIRLITGDEEARLTYVGLRDRLPAEGDVMIVDIGGGSTEIIQVADDTVVSSLSIPLGSGRLADAYFESDPPGIEALMHASGTALDRLESIPALEEEGEALLFAGGNGVFIQELVKQLFPDDPLSSASVERLLVHLAGTPAEDTAQRLGIALERARVLPAGAAIAMAFLLRTRYRMTEGVPSGIRSGLIREFFNSR